MYGGAVQPKTNTSFFPLAVVMLVVAFAVTFYTSYAVTTPGPTGASIGLAGIMPAKPPATAPTITSPINGQHFPTTPITVKGTCPNNTLVEIYKNNIFAGSVFCDKDGKYSIDIDLLFGQNVLFAQSFDALGQNSPPSDNVTVFYDASAASTAGIVGLDFGGAQLLINTDAVYRGNFPGKEMAMPLTVLGGRAPYAISIQWGDNENSLIPRGDNATFNATHTYKKPGVYPISIKATDKDGRVAFITVAAVVNGTPEPATASTSETATSSSVFVMLWPLYVAILGIIIAFFLGERREKHVLAKHHQLISQI